MTRNKRSKPRAHSLEVNLTRTYPMMPNKDEQGNYIAYCDYRFHPGVIIPGRIKTCNNKGCEHYKIYREEYQ